MKIALIGTRGIPASFGGFETAVEQLGKRLAERGHDVTVYCRTPHIRYSGDTYLGMRLVKFPTIRNKYLDTLFHTFIACVHACFQRYDVVLMFIAGNSVVSWIPRLVGTPVALNVDGLDWKRKKWNRFAKAYIRVAERLSRWLPTCVITDSRVVQQFYARTYGFETVFIPYGSEVGKQPAGATIRRLGLEPSRYILFVGRLVPENNAHHVLEAFSRLHDKRGLKLVIVGDAPYDGAYLKQVREQAAAMEDVVMAGYVYGEGYRELASNAFIAVVATEAGGTHPVLLEFMSLGRCVVVNNIHTNLETIGNAAVPYDGVRHAADLEAQLAKLVAQPETVAVFGRRAAERAAAEYRWEAVTDDYEHLCVRLASRQPVHRMGRGVQTMTSTD